MKVTHVVSFALCVAICVIPTSGSKILMAFPMAAPSHYILGTKLLHILANRGHEVTFITAFRDKNLPKSCREIYLAGAADAAEEQKRNFFEMDMNNVPFMIYFMGVMGANWTDTILSHPATQELLNNPKEKFDVVIIEEFVNHALKALAYKYNAPLISFSTIGPSAWTNSLTGNPAPTSYIPDLLLVYNGTMSYWQRFHNNLVSWGREIYERFVFYPIMDRIIQKYFPGAPSVEELALNVSFVLINSHVSTNQPVPLLPNMIEIGGYHVDPPKKLPDDLQKYLDGSKNGVVYFSMGSNLKSKYLPVTLRDSILKAFSKLKMNVLWKWEDDVLPGQPPNVKLSKWLPQQDLLAHPNVKLFITHGGLLSTIETIYHGVPIIGLPVFGDQELNMANAVANGFGVKLNWKSLTEEKLTAALNDVLNNPKYAENAKRRSKLMHDRIVSPKDEAGYWVEYVIRHGGARHYRSAALDLAWYQLYSLDIFASVLAVVVLSFYALSRIFKRKSKKQTDQKQKKKKNE